MSNKKHVHVDHSENLRKLETNINSLMKRSMKGNLLKIGKYIKFIHFILFFFQNKFQNGQCRTIKKFGKFCTFGCKKPFAFAICEK